jgi:hypothetical protein
VGLIILAFILLVPFVKRSDEAFTQTPAAMASVYEQMYQMGLFLERYYPGETVAINDIGAINYLADIRSVDVFGLGTKEVTSMIRKNTFDMPHLENLVKTRDIKIAALNNLWYKQGRIPPSWIEVGRWEDDDTAFGNYKYAIFYAVDPSEEAELTAHLREFAPQLPSTVIQSGKYTSQ